MMKPEASNPSESLRQNVETYLGERLKWMADAVEVYAGDRTMDPLEALPAPTEVRADGDDPNLTPEKESALREVASRFGLGGEVDVDSGADYQINEGGRARKIDAEAQINQAAQVVIFAGSPDRVLDPAKALDAEEIQYMKERLQPGSEVGKTEYEIAGQIAALQEGFVPLDEPEVLPYGYNIFNNHGLVQQSSGQLVKIGERNGVPQLLLRVDRHNLASGKFENRPDSAALMGFVSDVLSLQGDETSSVGLNSSTTYASRSIDAVRAGLERGRGFFAGMYGRVTLAKVERKPVPEPTEIQHIPGELHEIYKKLLQLRRAVDAKWPPADKA